MKVKCINDKNRPNEIPLSKWVKEGQEYTVTNVWKGGLMPNGGLDLAEITLDADCLPYRHFDPSRFVPVDDITPLLERIKNSVDEPVKMEG